MVHFFLCFAYFLKDCLKSYVIGVVLLFACLCIIYRCDKYAISITFTLFLIYILPRVSLLLVLMHRALNVNRRIKLSINIIIVSFSVWLITYFLIFSFLRFYFQEIFYRLFDRFDFKLGNIWIGDVYTIISDLVMIIALLCISFSLSSSNSKRAFRVDQGTG